MASPSLVHRYDVVSSMIPTREYKHLFRRRIRTYEPTCKACNNARHARPTAQKSNLVSEISALAGAWSYAVYINEMMIFWEGDQVYTVQHVLKALRLSMLVRGLGKTQWIAHVQMKSRLVFEMKVWMMVVATRDGSIEARAPGLINMMASRINYRLEQTDITSG